MKAEKTNSIAGPGPPVGTGSTRPREPRRRATGGTRKRAQPLASQQAIDPTEDHIRVRAYFLSLERNGSPADPIADWLLAERELTAGASETS